jgi:hypothetical protein
MTFSDVFSDDVTNPGPLMWLKTNYTVLQYAVTPTFDSNTNFPAPPKAPATAPSASDIYAQQKQGQQDLKLVQKSPVNFLGATVCSL